jgi:hypothetical protein
MARGSARSRSRRKRGIGEALLADIDRSKRIFDG